ncbi:MAG: putative tryptophan/tyrosine transport system substrate-binding protein [Candidatus Dependentiae bacterium]|nr:putative tryptophan/tyrosine transport system substrate-binding protein [Candidatus Dependentiae bacterium]
MAYHERVNNALIQEINVDKRFAVKEFTAASALDPLLVNATCDAALDSDVNLVICTGIACSRGFAQMAKKRHSTKPMVFMGVNNPVDIGIVASLEKPGGNITGVFSASFENKVDIATLLLTLKPTTKKVLLPYAAVTDGNEPLAFKIQEALKTNSVDVTLLPINNPNETISICTTVLPGHDMLMYLEADPIASNGSGLGKLASQHGVTMFASSIDGIKDAVFSYASDPISQAHIALPRQKKFYARDAFHKICLFKLHQTIEF